MDLLIDYEHVENSPLYIIQTGEKN